jgi:hypothetical protein
MFGWFRSKEEAQFGQELAQFLADRLPPMAYLSETKQRELYPKFAARIEQFTTGKKLNIYKKAQLANAFKWRLLDLGFGPKFVDEVTKELLIHL